MDASQAYRCPDKSYHSPSRKTHPYCPSNAETPTPFQEASGAHSLEICGPGLLDSVLFGSGYFLMLNFCYLIGKVPNLEDIQAPITRWGERCFVDLNQTSRCRKESLVGLPGNWEKIRYQGWRCPSPNPLAPTCPAHTHTHTHAHTHTNTGHWTKVPEDYHL